MKLKSHLSLMEKVKSIPHRNIATFFVCIMTALLIALAVWGLFSFQHIRKITIKGDMPYTEEELIAASGVDYGQLLFSTDTGKVERSILENKPYIREVKVRRWFFSRLVITVESDTAKYYINNGGSYYLLSEELRALDCRYSTVGFEEAGLVYLELPELQTCRIPQTVEYGEEGKNEFVCETLDFINSQNYASMVTEISLTSRFDNAYITFLGKCRVKLGKPENIELKIERARKHIEALSGDSNISCMIVDVSVNETVISYPNKLD